MRQFAIDSRSVRLMAPPAPARRRAGSCRTFQVVSRPDTPIAHSLGCRNFALAVAHSRAGTVGIQWCNVILYKFGRAGHASIAHLLEMIPCPTRTRPHPAKATEVPQTVSHVRRLNLRHAPGPCRRFNQCPAAVARPVSRTGPRTASAGGVGGATGRLGAGRAIVTKCRAVLLVPSGIPDRQHPCRRFARVSQLRPRCRTFTGRGGRHTMA